MTLPLPEPTNFDPSQPLDLTALILIMRRMAHDMRGTVMTLTATSDMLVQGIYGELNPQQLRASQRMQRNSYRLVAVIDDLMTYVKANTDQYPLNPQPFEPRLLLDQLCGQVAPTASSKGLALHWNTAEAVPVQLVGDVSAISRILLAVLWNAVGFTNAGNVRVDSFWTPDSRWQVTIQDSGPGIMPIEQERIFYPFYRGEKRVTAPTSGSGLGLTMALALTRVMGGTLTLDKSSEEGSTFCLQLPLQLPE